MSSTSLFPPGYAPWLADRLKGSVLETLATCDTCAMVKPEGLTRDPGPFEAHLKCCTYFPFIPNFSLGALFDQNSATLDLRLLTAEVQGLLLPLGLYATPERQNFMNGLAQNGSPSSSDSSHTGIEKSHKNGFGQRADLLCPFFEVTEAGCSIWHQRPGVCTTYFCKSDRGAEGLIFWADVEAYLNNFEWVLSREVLLRLGLDENEIEMCKATMTTEAGNPERAFFLEAAWGHWFSKKTEFFVAAAKQAANISSKEIASLLGNDFLNLEKSICCRSCSVAGNER